MQLSLLIGSAHPSLGEAIAVRLGIAAVARTVERFPDGELHVNLRESVRGDDLYVVQPTHRPVEANLFELLLLADASRRAGAARITAVVPYFGYARQDRRTTPGEAVGARVAADLIGAAAIDRVVAVDLHAAALEGFFSVPVEHLSALPLLADALRSRDPSRAVVVAPDLGAAKLAHRLAATLDLPVAIVHKTRLGPETVAAVAVAGEVAGRAPILVDDMLSTGATVEAAIRAVLTAMARPEVTIAATHGLFVGAAASRLRELPVRRCIVTDSVPRSAGAPATTEVVSLAGLLAEAIERLHGESGAAAKAAGR